MTTENRIDTFKNSYDLLLENGKDGQCWIVFDSENDELYLDYVVSNVYPGYFLKEHIHHFSVGEDVDASLLNEFGDEIVKYIAVNINEDSDSHDYDKLEEFINDNIPTDGEYFISTPDYFFNVNVSFDEKRRIVDFCGDELKHDATDQEIDKLAEKTVDEGLSSGHVMDEKEVVEFIKEQLDMV